MGCELRDQLGARHSVALNMMRRAQKRLSSAVTATNIECANTELRCVEEYRLDLLREIVEHCESHECATAEMEQICGRSLETRKRAVA